MSSAKISRIKNFANVGITAKSAKILLRENFPLYRIQVYHCQEEQEEVPRCHTFPGHIPGPDASSSTFVIRRVTHDYQQKHHAEYSLHGIHNTHVMTIFLTFVRFASF